MKLGFKILPFARGQQAEELACAYLIQQGLQLVAKNYRTKMGEIDLLMMDKDALVFIEVRYRQSKNFGSGMETVTYTKQKKLIKTAQYYLQQQRLTDKVPCRFDIIDISNHTDIEWIKNAF